MGQVSSDIYNSGRRNMHEILRQKRFLGICGRKTEEVWASSSHKKRRSDSGKARQKRRRETCGRERVKFANDLPCKKIKLCQTAKAVNLIRPCEVIKTPL